MGINMSPGLGVDGPSSITLSSLATTGVGLINGLGMLVAEVVLDSPGDARSGAATRRASGQESDLSLTPRCRRTFLGLAVSGRVAFLLG